MRESISKGGGFTAAIFKDLAFSVIFRFSGLGITFLTGIFLARNVGPGLFGEYSLAITWLAVFSVVMSVGMPELVMRSVASLGKLDKDKEIFACFLEGNLALIAVHLLGLALALLCVFIFSINPVYAVISVLLVSAGAFLNYFQGFIRGRFSGASALVVQSVIVPLTFLLLVSASIFIDNEVTLLRIFICLLLSNFIGLCCALYYVFRFFRTQDFPLSWQINGRLGLKLFAGLPFMLLALLALLNIRADMMVLGLVSTSAELGVYAAAAKLSELFLIPVVLINFSLLPDVVRLLSTREIGIAKARVVVVYKLIVLGYLPALLLAFLYSAEIVEFVYGAEFSMAAELLKMFLVAQSANILWGAGGLVLLAASHEGLSLKIGILAFVLSMFLMFVFGTTFGIFGLAFGSCIGFVIWRVMLSMAVDSKLGKGFSIISAI
ncbi:oligosaccharide flippase family protein [Halopseudomonas sp.]|uniref:oligosaccharide flippase family protein n=1 Tax=Halopseudomonas sp. TaxID=2901191 RepID=UPI00300362C2